MAPMSKSSLAGGFFVSHAGEDLSSSEPGIWAASVVSALVVDRVVPEKSLQHMLHEVPSVDVAETGVHEDDASDISDTRVMLGIEWLLSPMVCASDSVDVVDISTRVGDDGDFPISKCTSTSREESASSRFTVDVNCVDSGA